MKKSLGIIALILISFMFTCGCTKEDEKDGVVIEPPPPPPPPPASPNKIPFAYGGPNHFFYLPKDSVIVDASNSKDLDGSIVSYSLMQISGPAPSTIENHPSMLSIFRVKKLIAGSSIFELKVTDNNGDTGTDKIQVDPIQAPPSGTEYVLDSLVWGLTWDDYAYILETPERPAIFPNVGSEDFFQFPADIYLRYDTATLWSKLPPINTEDNVNYMVFI